MISQNSYLQGARCENGGKKMRLLCTVQWNHHPHLTTFLPMGSWVSSPQHNSTKSCCYPFQKKSVTKSKITEI